MASVNDLQYVGLAVPDLAAERDFFGKIWGLVEVGEQDGKVYFAAEGSPHAFGRGRSSASAGNWDRSAQSRAGPASRGP